MKICKNRVLTKISIGLILIGTSSCAQDSMIRVNSTSNLNLLSNKEIRYRSCGENTDSCKKILESINHNIANKKSELIKAAKVKLWAEREMAIKEFSGIRAKMITECINADYARTKNPGTYIEAINKDFTGRVTVRTDITVSLQRQRTCENSTPFAATGVTNNSKDENSFNLEEETRKLIKEVSNTSLNEYTFSKSDGSIVVICQTRYCAISITDAGWIGIGERGKSIDIQSVVR